MMKIGWKKITAIVIGSMLVAIASFITFVLTSQWGLDLSYRIAQRFVPDLTIQQLQGSIIGPITATQLLYNDPAIHVDIAKITLDWRFSQLLRGNIAINDLDIDTFSIIRKDIVVDDNTPQQITLKGHLHLAGTIAWSGTTAWDVTLKGNNIDPNLDNSTIHDELNFNIHSKGRWDKQPSLQVVINDLHGRLRQFPLQGSGQFEYHDSKLAVDHFSITSGQARIQANGVLNDNWDLNWNISLPHLENIFPASYGSIISEGQLSGDRDHPALKATANANNLHYLNNAIGEFNSTMNIHLGTQAPSQIRLNAKQIKLNDIAIDTISTQLQGTPAQHRLDLTINQRQLSLYTQIIGGWAQQQWQGNIQQLGIKDALFDEWRLHSPAPLSLSQTSAKLDNLCLQSIHGKLCADATWLGGSQWQANVDGKAIPLQLMADLIKPELRISGTVAIASHAKSDKHGTIHGNTTVSITPGKLTDPLLPTEDGLQFNGGELQAQLDKHGLKGNGEIRIPNQPPITASVDLPGFDTANISNAQAINANLTLKMNNLNFIDMLVPTLHHTSGNLQAAVDVSGTMAKPSITGAVNFGKGQTDIPKYGLKIRNISARAHGDLQKPLTFAANATSGKGTVTLNGQTDLQKTGLPTELTIKGTDLEVYNTLEANVLANPDFTIKYDNNRLDLTGDITIPTAKITPKDFSSTVTLPRDVVFVGDDDETEALQIYSRLTLRLGDDVSLSFMGLDATLGGELTIQDKPQGATTATGELYIAKGKFTAYGQNLVIRQGRLIYVGNPVDNPAINLEAVKHVTQFSSSDAGAVSSSDSFVGVRVTGNLQSPQMTLFSQPAGMNQSDILSYLVLGKPANSARGGDTALLGQALTALRLSNNQFATTKSHLQSTLGLDELGLESEQQYSAEQGSVIDNTSLVLGKTLSARLFVDYSIGLLEPINTLHIRYKLTDKLTLQSSSSMQSNGVDIFYTIEK